MRRAAATVLLLAIAPFTPAFAGLPEVVKVTASALVVRDGPSTSASSLVVVMRGESYPALERSGEWVRLQVGARAGWAHQDHLAQDPAALGVRWVLRSAVNVRTGPGTGYRILDQLPLGTPVAVVYGVAGWARVWFQSRDAYVWAGNLGTAPPSAAPPPHPRSAVGYLQLPANGPGFESYTTSSRRWGRPALIYGLERAAARWSGERRDRIGIGDISLQNGGYFPPHSAHQVGKEVDLALVRSDARELPVSIHQAQYSRTWTGRMLSLLRQEIPVDYVLFNDGGLPGVYYYPGHDDHMHLVMRN